MSHILLKTLNYRMDIVFPILSPNNVRKKKKNPLDRVYSFFAIKYRSAKQHVLMLAIDIV